MGGWEDYNAQIYITLLRDFGERLFETIAKEAKTHRETLGHSIKVMARHLDVAEKDIEAYEDGKEPPLPIILHYARMGYVTVESLIDDQMELERRT